MRRCLREMGLILAVMAVILPGCTRLQPVVTPTLQVQASNQRTIHEAIQRALLQRRWIILGQTPDSFDATYTRGGTATGKIRVTHRGSTVTIAYLDSANLDYTQESGVPEIHKTYNNWVTNLQQDIQVEVGRTL